VRELRPGREQPLQRARVICSVRRKDVLRGKLQEAESALGHVTRNVGTQDRLKLVAQEQLARLQHERDELWRAVNAQAEAVQVLRKELGA
jgi:hypothetical protein